MEQYKGTKLTLQIGDTITTWEVDHQDIDLDELFHGFQGVVVGQTFLPHSFVQECKDFYEELQDLYPD